MNDRRKSNRYSLKSTLDVIDMETREKTGDLITISPHVLLVKSRVPIDAGRQMELCLRLPTKIFGKQNIGIVAKCLWTKPDKDPNFQLSSLELIDLDPLNANVILGIIMEMGIPS